MNGDRSRRNTWWRLPALIGLTLALGACSAPQIAYNKLNWLTAWEVRKFVQLKPEQKTRFREDFQAFWDWHRQEELPRYANDLRAFVNVATSQPTAQELLKWGRRAEQHWNRSLDRIGPDLCSHLATMDTQQITSIQKRIDDRIAEHREEFVTPAEERVRKDSQKRLLERLEHWAGDLNAQQLQMVAKWTQERPLGYDRWLKKQKIWRQAFMTALARKDEPGFCHDVRLLFSRHNQDKHPGLPSRNDETRRQWSIFLANFLGSLTRDQKRHLTDKLQTLAGDLATLSSK